MLAGLAGCAFSDPRIDGPAPSSWLEPGFAADLADMGTKLGSAWSAVAGLARDAPADSPLARMTQVVESQWRVVIGPDPVNRVPNTRADPGEPAAVTDTTDGLAKADAACATVRDTAQANAGKTAGITAAWWASLAAGAEQVRRGLQGAYDSPSPVDPGVTIALTELQTALPDLISRHQEGIFVLRTAMGFLTADADRAVFQSALSTLQSELAALTDQAASRGVTPPTSPGIYELPGGRDSQAAMALLASVQQSLVEAAVVWVAATDDPARAVPYVMSAATLGSALGIGTAVWPGWPD